MPAEIFVCHEGVVSRFSFKKVDRSDLYGRRKRIPLDPKGQVCQRAELVEDGVTLVLSGMTGQGHYDERGARVSSRRLVGVYPDGRVAKRHPSTLNSPQDLMEVTPQDLLDHRVEAVYQLAPKALDPALAEALERGAIYQMPFSYRGGYRLEVAFLLRGPDGLFALVGQPTTPRWCTPAEIPVGGVEAFNDDLSFEVP